jgi:hypothetical protein
MKYIYEDSSISEDQAIPLERLTFSTFLSTLNKESTK